MTLQRPAAFVSFFLVVLLALWGSDVALCQQGEAAPENVDGVQTAMATDAQVDDEASDAATDDKPLSPMPGEDDAEDNMPEDESTSARIMDRPLDERPRTTKHLYTTKRTMRTEVRRANRRAAAAKFLSLAIFLVAVAVAVVLKGKLSAGEEDDEDDEDEK